MLNPMEKFMKTSSMSPQELSEKLDVSRNTIYHWIRGDTKPSKGNMQRLSKVMGKRTLELRLSWHDWEEVKNG